MRIVRTRWKIAYFAITYLASVALVRILAAFALPTAADASINALLSAAMFLGAARAFRGRGEAVIPARPWWRMTARPKASLMLAIVLIAVTVALLIPRSGIADGISAVQVANAIVGAIFAALFFTSWVRLRRNRPPGWQAPMSAEWRPAPRQRAPR